MERKWGERARDAERRVIDESAGARDAETEWPPTPPLTHLSPALQQGPALRVVHGEIAVVLQRGERAAWRVRRAVHQL